MYILVLGEATQDMGIFDHSKMLHHHSKIMKIMKQTLPDQVLVDFNA